MAGAVDQRFHILRIKPVDVLGSRYLFPWVDYEGSGERLEVVMALLADLQMQNSTAVGIGIIRIPILPIEIF
jgi:hypothetical protein